MLFWSSCRLELHIQFYYGQLENDILFLWKKMENVWLYGENCWNFMLKFTGHPDMCTRCILLTNTVLYGMKWEFFFFSEFISKITNIGKLVEKLFWIALEKYVFIFLYIVWVPLSILPWARGGAYIVTTDYTSWSPPPPQVHNACSQYSVYKTDRTCPTHIENCRTFCPTAWKKLFCGLN